MPGCPSGLTCNVATGSRHTLIELLNAICAAVGREVDPIIGPPRAGDIIDSQADITVAQRELGYKATVSFQEGIARSVDWLRGVPPA
jgi:nucleoside-diphosphate-sugar epimerase